MFESQDFPRLSHELRTQLQAIQNALELLEGDFHLSSAERDRYWNYLKTATERMQAGLSDRIQLQWN